MEGAGECPARPRELVAHGGDERGDVGADRVPDRGIPSRLPIHVLPEGHDRTDLHHVLPKCNLRLGSRRPLQRREAIEGPLGHLDDAAFERTIRLRVPREVAIGLQAQREEPFVERAAVDHFIELGRQVGIDGIFETRRAQTTAKRRRERLPPHVRLRQRAKKGLN